MKDESRNGQVERLIPPAHAVKGDEVRDEGVQLHVPPPQRCPRCGLGTLLNVSSYPGCLFCGWLEEDTAIASETSGRRGNNERSDERS